MNTKMIWILLLFSAYSFSQDKTAGGVKEQGKESFLVPYRVQDKWGLSDTLGNIKIQPQYDDLIDAFIYPEKRQSFYYFKANGKTILADHNNNRYFQEYDSIDYKKNFVYKGGKIGLYGMVYADSDSDQKNDFKLILKPVYNTITIDEPYYVVSQNGKKGLLQIGYDKNIKNLLAVEYDSIVVKDKLWIGYKMSKGKRVQQQLNYDKETDIPSPVAEQKSNTATKPEAQANQKKKQLVSNLTRDASKEDLEKILPIRITPVNLYVKYREKNKTGIASFYYSLDGPKKLLLKQVIVPAEYDSIEEMDRNRYLVMNNGKFGIKATFSEGNIEPVYDGIAYYPGFTNFILLKKGNKYAVYSTLQNKAITDFEFDGYSYKPSQDNLYYLLLEKDKKRGLLNAEGIIVPAIYDAIVIDTARITYEGRTSDNEYLKFKKDGRYGIINLKSKITTEVPFEFDDIFPGEQGYYITVSNQLKGAYSAQQKINIPPKYQSIQLFERIYIHNSVIHFFKVVTVDGKKIIISQNGKEFYTK